MSIRVTPLEEADPSRTRDLAVGTFDGVHAGHRAVIEGADTVLTFEPHPLTVLRPEMAPELIMSFEMKCDILAGLGIEEVVVIDFDREFSKVTADEFIDEILLARLNASKVSIGANFRFGNGAVGDAALLSSRSEFETRVAPLVQVGGEPVSSTRIRELVARGEVAEAAKCLGGPYMLEGEVVHGDKRGRELGYPTANLIPAADLILPAHGVYAAFANEWAAAVNVGVRPTFGEQEDVLVEAHLIDREEDLYGRRLRVAFVERLRDEEDFAGADDLIRQMRDDVVQARTACAEFRGS